MSLKRHQKTLLWAVLAALALWTVSPLRWLLLPLIYYNTHVHELCHALATVATGGQVGLVEVYADGSGSTLSAGGSAMLVGSAGYVGSAIVGGLLVFGSGSAESARRILWVAFGFLAFGMAFFVRGDTVGVVSGLAWMVALAAAAKWLKGDALVFSAQFLGVQQCLTSAQSMLVLLRITVGDLGHNDAANLQRITGVPAVVWAFAWLCFGVFVVGMGLRAAWSNRP
jgi:hypothetical protein